MLLFSFLLLSTVLAAAQDLDADIRVKALTEDGQIKSLEFQEDDEALTFGWSDVQTDEFSYYMQRHIILDLRLRNITGFGEGWYGLNNQSFQVAIIISNNEIEHLNDGMADGKNLVLLDFSRNSIRKIESGALSKLELLQHLHLEKNNLTDTEFAATLPPNLESLYLSSNAITKISAYSFAKLGKLQILALDDNKIKTITQQAFHGLLNVYLLYLSDNPIEKVEDGSFVCTPLLNEILLNNWKVTSLANVNDVLSPSKKKKFVIIQGEHLAGLNQNHDPRTETELISSIIEDE